MYATTNFAANRKMYYRVIKKGEQMKRIVLLRHGESTWNKDNRFTGWTDVDLTEKGIADANQAGILLKRKKDFILIKLTLLF